MYPNVWSYLGRSSAVADGVPYCTVVGVVAAVVVVGVIAFDVVNAVFFARSFLLKNISCRSRKTY